MADALDARRAEGWPDSSEASAALAAGIATLDGRISKTLAERDEADRKAERDRIAQRTAAVRDEAAIGRLKAAAAREAEGVAKFRKWHDGEFGTQFAELDRQKAALDGFSAAADLPKAKEAAADIHSAVVWIEDNAKARKGLDAIEKALGTLSADVEKYEAKRYAKAALYQAESARKDAVRLRDRSDFTGARAKFEEAKRLTEEAIADSRKAQTGAKAALAVGEAEAAKIREDWAAVLAKAEEALALEPGNSSVLALKNESESELARIAADKAATEEAKRKAEEEKRKAEEERRRAEEGRARSPSAPQSAPAARSENTPSRTVTIDLGDGVSLEMVHCPGVAQDFWMGKYEVTQEQWQRVMGYNPSHFTPSYFMSLFTSHAKFPVESVSWDDCMKFVKKLNALPGARSSGLTFRLPKEKEWEICCRAGAPSSADYCKLMDGTLITAETLSRVARYGKGMDDGPANVGSFLPNAWGLYDMHGNVYEWTENPHSQHMDCGGSFIDSAVKCMAGYPYRKRWSESGVDLGFRLAAFGNPDSANPSSVDMGISSADDFHQNDSSHQAGYRFVAKVGSVSVPLRWCPPGSFTMGSPSSEEGRYDDETQHRVTLTKGFWMGETEVTQGLWKEVMGTTVRQQRDKENGFFSLFGDGDVYPMYYISWDECQEFVSALNSRYAQSGLRWTLPTEAQWEYACRAGTTGAYGGIWSLDDMGWDSNSGGTHPVGKKLANTWGLYDMHGNVCEWCADWYDDYPSGSVTDPSGPADGSRRVNRGGSFNYDRRGNCRSASRFGDGPGSRLFYCGFRVALVPVQ